MCGVCMYVDWESELTVEGVELQQLNTKPTCNCDLLWITAHCTLDACVRFGFCLAVKPSNEQYSKMSIAWSSCVHFDPVIQ